MTPDDRRHGTPAGYVAGCREDCCRRPRMRQQKATRYAVAQGRRTFYPLEDYLSLVSPWLRQGLSETAVLDAAGLSHRDRGNERVTATTYDAVARVVEADFRPNHMVYADLTRRRIYSLMAAGHELQHMPISSRGVWRTVPRLRVGWVRVMRDYYAANEFTLGTNLSTAARARNAGHVPPLAWDDPRTLAWPTGKAPRIVRGTNHRRKDDVDPMVVERVLGGDMIASTLAEKHLIMARLSDRGGSVNALCRRMGWQETRYIPKDEG